MIDRRRFIGGMTACMAIPAQASAADDRTWATIPPSLYYSDEVRRRWRSWGPASRQFPAPPDLDADEASIGHRLTRAALGHLGLGYQHHHVPDFAPPPDWPWLPVSAGRDGPGLDCSNFTALAYNQALGLKLSGDVHEQAEAIAVPGPGGIGTAAFRRIVPRDHDDAVALLAPGDLLYIRSDAGRVSHVVLWLGGVGGVPSFVDCTDSVRSGPDGRRIPTGVAVRPFLPGNWYGRSFSHAHRITGLDRA